ncbi:hypothetical protein [Micromonospora sp. NPDC048169]|uniref:hypothetical protein n=1 Tax=unclassified Micromonospora TaxID=2617518 RepID=UPI0033C0D42F
MFPHSVSVVGFFAIPAVALTQAEATPIRAAAFLAALTLPLLLSFRFQIFIAVRIHRLDVLLEASSRRRTGCVRAALLQRQRVRRSIAAILRCASLLSIPAIVVSASVFSKRLEGAELEKVSMTAIMAILFFCGFSLPIISGKLHTLSRRLAAEVPEPSSTAGLDGFVLYLRPFRNDRIGARIINASLYDHWRALRRYTEEEILCFLLGRAFGDVVAMGSPSDRLPAAGAKRIYVPDRLWRAEVTSLITRAVIVVVNIAEGKQTLWEIKKARERLDVTRILLLAPLRTFSEQYIDELCSCFEDAPYFRTLLKLHNNRTSHDWPGLHTSSAYITAFWFDGRGAVHQGLADWNRFQRPDDHELLSAFGLTNFFLAHGRPGWAYFFGFGCCRKRLDQPHGEKTRCRIPKTECPGVVNKISTPSGARPSCCPACLRAREKGAMS